MLIYHTRAAHYIWCIKQEMTPGTAKWRWTSDNPLGSSKHRHFDPVGAHGARLFFPNPAHPQLEKFLIKCWNILVQDLQGFSPERHPFGVQFFFPVQSRLVSTRGYRFPPRLVFYILRYAHKIDWKSKTYYSQKNLPQSSPRCFTKITKRSVDASLLALTE